MYCKLQNLHHIDTVLIQASMPVTPTVLQAEAAALNLAGKVASLLQIQQVTFLTDSLTLAKAVVASSLQNLQVPWEIRVQICRTLRRGV